MSRNSCFQKHRVFLVCAYLMFSIFMFLSVRAFGEPMVLPLRWNEAAGAEPHDLGGDRFGERWAQEQVACRTPPYTCLPQGAEKRNQVGICIGQVGDQRVKPCRCCHADSIKRCNKLYPLLRRRCSWFEGLPHVVVQ